jgi:hypothetical protein
MRRGTTSLASLSTLEQSDLSASCLGLTRSVLLGAPDRCTPFFRRLPGDCRFTVLRLILGQRHARPLHQCVEKCGR